MTPSQTWPEPAAAAPMQRPGAWRALGGAALVALLLHALLLGWLPMGVGAGWRGHVAPVLSVRQIVRQPATLPDQMAPSSTPPRQVRPPLASTEPLVPAPVHPQPQAIATAPDQPAPAELPQTTPSSSLPDVGAEAQAAAAAASEPTAGAAMAEAGGQGVPTYATRRPPGAVLQFELRRAGLVGKGELTWRPTEQGYTMQMSGSAFALPLLTWTSEGAFDGDGLAPMRFVDSRRLRDVRAANFQRDKGRITYSGPAIEHPLVRGAQDRLSWMVQLPAVIAADPENFAPGARVSMFVAGARGDADVWTFSVEAREAVDVIEGRVASALKLVREPRRPYDTRVEVWLDPARHFLPVKLRLLQPQAGEGFEFTLQGMTLLP